MKENCKPVLIKIFINPSNNKEVQNEKGIC
jgi:hypothetical protein